MHQFNFKEIVYCILLILGLQFSVFSQIEANNWFFGEKAGINFSTGYPDVLATGKMNAPAGCSSISDKNGNLLFYTNGQTVWNKNHEIMTGGIGLSGEIENVQSCIIIPKPNDESVYYIFTTREHSNTPLSFSPGIYYSEVNFSAENPLGKVINLNAKINGFRTNQITAIHAPDGETIRVIAFEGLYNTDDSPKNIFFFITVTPDGVQLSVDSSVVDENLTATGALRISPDGKMIAIADQGERYIYLYKFDNETLELSYFTTINCDLFFVPLLPYGMEFSQNSKILYFTGNNDSSSYLFQLDFFNPDGFIGKEIISSSGTFKYGNLQMARDGKLYISAYKNTVPVGSRNFVGVINRPDYLGTKCAFEQIGTHLDIDNSLRGSLMGLPNYITSIFRNRIITDDRCADEAFDFELDSYAPITAVTWDFGDGATSTSFTPTHQYSEGKDYLVKATIILKNNPITLFKHISAYPVPSLTPSQTLKQCDLDSDGFSYFNLYTIKDMVTDPEADYEYFFYKTHNDAVNNVNLIENPRAYENITNPEEIFVRIVSAKGCSSISSFFIETTYVELGQIPTIYACEGSDDVFNNGEGVFNLMDKETEIRQQFNIPSVSMLSFYNNSQDAQTRTNELSLSAALSSGIIWVRVDNQDFSCGGIAPISTVVNSAISLDIQEEYKICNPDLQPQIILNGGATNSQWEWRKKDGSLLSTLRTFSLVEAGSFSVTVYKAENGITCSVTKNFVVTQAPAPAFDVVIAEDEKIYASIKGLSNYEFSLNGSDFFGDGKNYTFRDIPGGVYIVYARDKDNCDLPISIKVSLIGYPKYFSPNHDGLNESWKLQGVSKLLYTDAQIFIYNRYGNFIHYMNLDGNQIGWDGTLNGKSLPASDYWYTSVLTDKDNNVFSKKGHFSLVR